MAFDGMMLAAIVAQLRAEALGARVNRIGQPTRHELVLWLYRPRQELRLLLSAHPRHARVHLTRAARTNPAAPPAFCMLLRKHLEGARLVEVEQPGWERLCRLRFQTLDEFGAPAVVQLVAETMGRYSNVVLVDADGRVLDALRRAAPDANPDRPVWPGFRYQPPAAQPKLDPASPDLGERLLARLTAGTAHGDGVAENAPPHARTGGRALTAGRWLQAQVDGISPLLAAEAAARAAVDPDAAPLAIPDSGWRAMAATLSAWARDLPAGRWSCTAAAGAEGRLLGFHAVELRQFGPAAALTEYRTPSELLDAVFAAIEAADALRSLRDRLQAAVAAERARAARKLDLQESALADAAQADRYRRYGELLTAHLHAIPAGARSARVIDWYDPDQRPVDVPLEANLSPAANAQRYFRRYQRARNTLVAAAAQAQRSRELLRYLDEVESAIDRARSVDELAEIELELRRERLIEAPAEERRRERVPGRAANAARGRRAGRRGDPPPAPPLRFRTTDGLEVLVGRNNRQNDWLTLRHARPDDVWLHTKDIAGAHVLLRLPAGGDPPDRSLLEAAELAALHSRGARGSNVPVDYTRARHVRKPSGARPGMVVYDHHRTLFVTPDAALSDRLRESPPSEHQDSEPPGSNEDGLG